jgi:hypothetical protein
MASNNALRGYAGFVQKGFEVLVDRRDIVVPKKNNTKMLKNEKKLCKTEMINR